MRTCGERSKCIVGFISLTFMLLSCSADAPSTEYHVFLISSHDSSYLDLRFVVRSGMALSDGIVTNFDPQRVYFGHDSTIIAIRGNRLFGKRAGSTTIFVRHPNPDSSRVVDSLALEVGTSGSQFEVKENAAP